MHNIKSMRAIRQSSRAFKEVAGLEYLLRGRQLPEELFADCFVDGAEERGYAVFAGGIKAHER